jgi:hypothetical protein
MLFILLTHQENADNILSPQMSKFLLSKYFFSSGMVCRFTAMPNPENPTTNIERLRFSVADVTKLIVFVGGMMFQYFSFKSEIREAILEQKGREDIISLRMQTVEENNRLTTARLDAIIQQPAMKPKSITLPGTDEPGQ